MSKSILITLVLLLILVGLYLGLGGDSYTSTVRDEKTAGFESFTSVDFDDVARITVDKGKGEQVVLEKQKDGWVVASSWNYEADGEKVEKIIDSVKEIDDGTIVGRRTDSHRDLEVDKVHGGFLAFFDAKDQKLGELVIGKGAPFSGSINAERQVFVRFNGEDTTYRVSSSVQSETSLYSQDVEGKRYLETTIFELPSDHEIHLVRLVRDGKDDIIVERLYRLKEEEEKEGEEETEPEGGDESEEPPAEEKKPEKEEYFVVTSGHDRHEVEKEVWKPRGLLDRGKTIRIEDATEPKDLAEYGLDKPQIQAVISHRKKDDENARPTQIEYHIGNAYKDDEGEDKGYYVLLKGTGKEARPYKMAKWDFSGWNKELKDLLPKPEEEEKKPEPTGETPKPGGPEGASETTSPPPAKPADEPPVPQEAGPKRRPKTP
ncbi:MAG: DUF4340 domain-containing protein [Planctomycetota bacterium]|nr:DUF4340 domain-containing protein [Planctomycetota bacterium]